MTKTCTKCGETKALSEFYYHPRITTADHYQRHCRACARAYSREYYKRNPSYKKVDPATDRRKRENHGPEDRRASYLEGLPVEDYPEIGSDRDKKGTTLWSTHRLTLLRYETMLALGCNICGNITKQPVIDHDHSCCVRVRTCGSCVRGVICRSCNTKLGHLEAGYDYQTKDPEWYSKVVAYLAQ